MIPLLLAVLLVIVDEAGSLSSQALKTNTKHETPMTYRAVVPSDIIRLLQLGEDVLGEDLSKKGLDTSLKRGAPVNARYLSEFDTHLICNEVDVSS